MPRVVFYCNAYLRERYLTNIGKFMAQKDDFILSMRQYKHLSGRNFEVLIEVRSDPSIRTPLIFLEQFGERELIRSLSCQSNTIYVHLIPHMDMSQNSKQKIADVNHHEILQPQSLMESRVTYEPAKKEGNNQINYYERIEEVEEKKVNYTPAKTGLVQGKFPSQPAKTYINPPSQYRRQAQLAPTSQQPIPKLNHYPSMPNSLLKQPYINTNQAPKPAGSYFQTTATTSTNPTSNLLPPSMINGKQIRMKSRTPIRK